MATTKSLISRPKAPAVWATRPLAAEELPSVIENPSGGEKHRLKKIRDVHHQAARAMATGGSNMEVGAVVGMSAQRINELRHDPAFQELLAHYREENAEIWRNVRERASQLGITASEVIQERLLERPESVATKDLLAVMQSGLDYGGHKQSEKHEHVHAHGSLERIRRLRENSAGSENVVMRQPGASDSEEPSDGQETASEGPSSSASDANSQSGSSIEGSYSEASGEGGQTL
jgi:hypothetical protein